MIRILYGERGSGKTERVIDMANAAVKNAKGHVVFISRDNRYMLTVNHDVRYIDASEYKATAPEQFIGFLNGLLAGNFDIETIFLLGFPRLGGFGEAVKMDALMAELNELSEKNHVEFVISVRGERDNVPESMKPYIID